MQVDKDGTDTHIIEWRIYSFTHSVIREGEKLECPVSTAGNLFETRWVPIIYPKGQKEYRDFLSCFIRRDDKEKVGPDRLHVEFEFSLLSFDGVKIYKKQGSEEFKRNTSFGFPKFAKLEEIFLRKEFLLQFDTLRVSCKLRLLSPKTMQTSHQIFMTKFPIEMIASYLDLDNFRNITKQNPRILNIKGTNNLLSLNVSMNKDETSDDQVSKSAVGPGASGSFLHIVMVKKKTGDPVHVTCWVRLLDKEGGIVMNKSISHLFSKIDKREEWVFPYFIDTNNLKDNCIWENDTLSLAFDFTICQSQPQSLQTADLTPMKFRQDPKETTLIKDLVDLHETSKFSDVTLCVGDETFPAHKCLLASRSPRFGEIFTRLMKNKTNSENRIVVSDVDKCTMALMLKFIYTDKLEDVDDESCLLLYSVAQKYQISSLQFKCVSILKKNLSIKAVYKALVIAEEFKDSELKLIALDLILEHYEHVLLTPEWQTFTEQHELSNQVLRHIRLKKKQLNE